MSAETARAVALRPARRLVRLGISRREELLIGAVPYVILVVLVAWFGYLIPASLAGAQISLSINQSLVLMLVAVGQTFVLLSGGIDLSVGGIISVTNAVATVHMATKNDVILVSVILLALGWIPGAINGALIVYFRLQPFIVTLGTWFIWGGVAFYVLPTAGGTINQSLGTISTGSTLGVDNTLWVFAVIAVAGMWILRTRAGIEIRALGSDSTSARLAGLRTDRALISAYALSSLFAVAAGLALSAQSLSGDPTVGDKYLLLSVAAPVIGGTSLFGGSATAIGTLVGSLVLGYVARVTFAVGLPSEWGLIFSGILLALAVALQGLVRAFFGRRA